MTICSCLFLTKTNCPHQKRWWTCPSLLVRENHILYAPLNPRSFQWLALILSSFIGFKSRNNFIQPTTSQTCTRPAGTNDWRWIQGRTINKQLAEQCRCAEHATDGGHAHNRPLVPDRRQPPGGFGRTTGTAMWQGTPSCRTKNRWGTRCSWWRAPCASTCRYFSSCCSSVTGRWAPACSSGSLCSASRTWRSCTLRPKQAAIECVRQSS